MKSQKSILTIFTFLFFVSSTFGQIVEKTLVKSFNLQSNKIVLLELNGPVTLNVWNKDILRVQMAIRADNITEAVLKALITSRRYDIASLSRDGELVLYTPGLEKEIEVGGTLLHENIEYIINIPKTVIVKQKELPAELAIEEGNPNKRK